MNFDFDLISLLGAFVPYLIAILASSFLDKRRFISGYVRVLAFFSAVSLLLYAAGIIAPSYIAALPDTGYRGFKTFFGLHTYLYTPSFGGYISPSEYLRNSGMFREPGLFAIFLHLGLYFLLFCKEGTGLSRKARGAVLVLLSVTMLSTLSTAGICSMAALFLGYFFRNMKLKTEYLLILILLLGFAVYNAPTLFEKFDPDNTISYESTSMRMDGMRQDVEIWKMHPVFGAGVTKYEALTKGSTNSFTYVLALFGPLFALLLVIMLWNSIVRSRAKLFSMLAIFLSFTVNMISQNTVLFPAFLLALFVMQEPVSVGPGFTLKNQAYGHFISEHLV